MALRDPVAVYNGQSNIDAAVVREMLLAAEIEAHLVEDFPQLGTFWFGGTLPQVHKPQVWVDKADLQRAQPLVADYIERTRADAAAGSGEPIIVTCEECSQTTTFPAERLGGVDECSHCGAFVDVGEDDLGWDNGEDLLDEALGPDA